ncbi:hypothetical protein [Pseudonocardia sp. GCM10023141]|uniref:hypothetical protein n=1 Tax=Pseudonocardia sp. GCM10023141 TaxID=3252653 RepID=UPI0036079DFF
MRPYRNVADVVQAIVDGPVGETAVLRVAPGPTADAGQPRPSHLLGPVAAQHGRPAAMPSAASA